jgi:hypothetical protein
MSQEKAHRLSTVTIPIMREPCKVFEARGNGLVPIMRNGLHNSLIENTGRGFAGQERGKGTAAGRNVSHYDILSQMPCAKSVVIDANSLIIISRPYLRKSIVSSMSGRRGEPLTVIFNNNNLC